MNRRAFQTIKIVIASLLSLYNLLLFAVHLWFDFGSEYVWISYPVACLTWSYSVILLLVEQRNGAKHNWVLKFFWGLSAILAT